MSARPSFFRKFYKAHVYVGLYVAVHFAILGLSGLVLLFKDELTGAAPASRAAPGTLDGAAFERAWKLAHAEHPRDRPLAIFPDEKDGGAGQLRLGIDGERKFRGARKIRFELATGRAIESNAEGERGFFPWLLELHRDLLLGSTGKLYIGFVGLMYAFMLLSGAIIYGRFMRGRRFSEVRAGPPVRRARDLHKLLGGVTFAWGLVVGLSGVFLAFNGVLLKLHQAQALSELRAKYAPAETTDAASLAPLDAVFAAVRDARPDSTITYVAFPDTEFSIPGHFLVLANGRTTFTEKLSEMVVVESATGRLVDVLELPWYLKFTMLSEPLHFGDYGGLPLKLGWALFTLLSLGVVGMGVFAFWRKRRAPATAGAESPRGSREAPAPVPTSPYRAPATLASLTLGGILVALAADGALGVISGMLAWVPAVATAAIVFERLRRAQLRRGDG